MYRIILISIFLFSSFLINAQHEDYYVSPDTTELTFFNPETFEHASQNSSPFNRIDKDNFNVRLDMGSSYTNLFGTNVFSTYTAPQVSYDVNPKLRLSAGTMFSYTSFDSGFYNNESSMSHENRIARYYMFAKGEYRLSENVNIRGATFFEVGQNQGHNRMHIHNIGFDFKLGENSSIHADFIFGNYSNPFDYHNPFYGGRNAFNNRHRPSNFGLFY